MSLHNRTLKIKLIVKRYDKTIIKLFFTEIINTNKNIEYRI